MAVAVQHETSGSLLLTSNQEFLLKQMEAYQCDIQRESAAQNGFEEPAETVFEGRPET